MLQQHTAAMNKAGALVNVRSAQPTPIEIAGRTLTSLYFYKNMNSFLPWLPSTCKYLIGTCGFLLNGYWNISPIVNVRSHKATLHQRRLKSPDYQILWNNLQHLCETITQQHYNKNNGQNKRGKRHFRKHCSHHQCSAMSCSKLPARFCSGQGEWRGKNGIINVKNLWRQWRNSAKRGKSCGSMECVWRIP